MIRLLGLLVAMATVAAVAAIAVPTPVVADELRPGYIEFSEKRAGHWNLTWSAPMQGGVRADTVPVLPRNCREQAAPQRIIAGSMVVARSQVQCRGDVAGQQIGLSGFASAQTDVLVRIRSANRTAVVLRLTAAAPMATIPARPNRWAVAKTYFQMGISHILGGFDHLLFVIALVLLLAGPRAIIGAITAFTVAHSLTLAGVTLGLFGLPQAAVEAVIALSILFLAVEIAKQEPGAPRLSERRPWLVAFAFGLLHGFGFAGALAEIGLPEGEVPAALLTFNLGVEAGQLAVVVMATLTLAAIRRWVPKMAARLITAVGHAIGALAAYWLIDRIFA